MRLERILGGLDMSFREFEIKELSDCIELIIDHRGKTPKKLGGDWVRDGIMTISAKNVHDGKLTNIEDIRFVEKKIYEKWMKEDVKRGDCFISSEGATLGESLYWDRDEKIVLGQRLFCIRTNNEILDSKYFSAYIRSREYQKEIDAAATGTSVLGMRQTALLKTKVLIPDIMTQRYVGGLYYDINKKIETNSQINKTLEKIAQTIFKQWFVDFEFPNEDGEPYQSSYGEMVESELGVIPKGWEIKELGDIIELYDSKRIPLSKNVRDKKDKIYPYYGAASLMDYVDEYIFDGLYILLGEDGTVVTPSGKPILQYVWGKFWVNNHAHVITGKKGVSINYLYILLSNLNVSGAITGAVQLKINQKNLKELKIIMPNDMKIISQFSEIVDKSFEKIRITTDENNVLVLLRDALLPKLMSGEIRVPLDSDCEAL